MNDDIPENDALWRLLAKSRRPEASPFFTRNVLREIRQAAPPPAFRLVLRWLAPAAYAAILLGFLLTLTQNSPIARSPDFDILTLVEEDLPSLEFTPAHLAGL